MGSEQIALVTKSASLNHELSDRTENFAVLAAMKGEHFFVCLRARQPNAVARRRTTEACSGRPTRTDGLRQRACAGCRVTISGRKDFFPDRHPVAVYGLTLIGRTLDQLAKIEAFECRIG